jgi:hypothetical protein
MRSNVYYLPAPVPAAELAARLSPALRFRLRLYAFGGRLRAAAAEMADVLRRLGRPEPDDDERLVLERRADLVLSARPAPAGPARIVDLAAARARLRR